MQSHEQVDVDDEVIVISDTDTDTALNAGPVEEVDLTGDDVDHPAGVSVDAELQDPYDVHLGTIRLPVKVRESKTIRSVRRLLTAGPQLKMLFTHDLVHDLDLVNDPDAQEVPELVTKAFAELVCEAAVGVMHVSGRFVPYLKYVPVLEGRDDALEGLLKVSIYVCSSRAFRPWGDTLDVLSVDLDRRVFPLASTMALILMHSASDEVAGSKRMYKNLKGVVHSLSSQSRSTVVYTASDALALMHTAFPGSPGPSVAVGTSGGTSVGTSGGTSVGTAGGTSGVPDELLTVDLLPYQRHAVSRMQTVEAAVPVGGFRSFLWCPLPGSKTTKTDAGNTCTCYYSPVLERLSFDVPEQPVGGILAEEMGMGKTVEVLALIAADLKSRQHQDDGEHDKSSIKSKATLVVCPVSLVEQWRREALGKLRGSCRVYVYHGPSRMRDVLGLATSGDIVITTYQTLMSDYKKKKMTHDAAAAAADDNEDDPNDPNDLNDPNDPNDPNQAPNKKKRSRSSSGSPGTDDDEQPGQLDAMESPCHAIRWHRIVFDEAHQLVGSASGACFRAMAALHAPRRWACTGTPLTGSNTESLQVLLRVLELSPLSRESYFDTCRISKTWVLAYCMGLFVTRHSKSLLTLPPVHQESIGVDLVDRERSVYLATYERVARQWNALCGAGQDVLGRRMFTVTSLLMPLRRICAGGNLSAGDTAVPNVVERMQRRESAPTIMTDLQETHTAEVPLDVGECAICCDDMNEPVRTSCNHWFCGECIQGWMVSRTGARCPMCRGALSAASFRRGVASPAPATGAGAGGGPTTSPTELFRSKLDVLVHRLQAMRQQDASAKALVFTQFTQTLSGIEERLRLDGIRFSTIMGSMTRSKRDKAIESFNSSPPGSVFLLTVRSSSVGINLTAANHVFIMEPLMNHSMERQAIGRVWRLGQAKPVHVTKFYVKGSVEEATMQLVAARQQLAAASTPADLGDAAGDQTRVQLKLAELQKLFAAPAFAPEG
jgi:superfamily II DNA or RNA helicase